MKTTSNPTGYSLSLWTLLLTFLSTGCQHAAEENTANAPKAPAQISAETLQVAEQSWPLIVRSQGSLFPEEEATLGIKIEGRVVDIRVDLGDVVEEGESLLTVHQDDFKLRVEQAQAQLTQARSAVGLRPEDPVERLQPVNAPPVKEQRALWDEATANLNRAQELLTRGAIVQSEYDQLASAERVAAARYDSALNSVREKIAFILVQQAALDLAREELENTVLKAPFTAVVQRRLVSPGSYVKVGDPLFVLVRVDQLRYRGTVPERLSQQIQLGQPIELQIESIPEPRMAKVTRISPFLDQMSRALLFEAKVENPDRQLRAGLFAEGKVNVDPQAQAIVVPTSAVVQFAGSEKVWKVVNGEVKEQVVLIGERRNQQVRILEGLKVGDIILRDASKGQVGVLVSLENQTAVHQPTPVPET